MKKYLSAFMIFVLVLLSTMPVNYVNAASKIGLNRNSVSIGITETLQLKVVNIPTSLKNEKILWKSNDSKIATVNNSGIVTGIKKGSTYITATINKTSLKCIISVRYSQKNIIDAINNITYTSLENNNIYYVLTNNSKLDLPFECKITFYKDNSPVSIQKINSFIFTNSKQVIQFNKSDKDYDSYKLSFSNGNIAIPKNLNSKIDVAASYTPYKYISDNDNTGTIQEDVNLIDLSINNRSEDLINLNAYVVYYLNNNIVSIQSYISYTGNIDIGETILYNPLVAWKIFLKQTPNVDSKLPDYDNYEVIYSAYKY